MTLDLTKPVQTRRGDPVTLVLTNARGPFPLAGYIGDYDSLSRWKRDGSFCVMGLDSRDLINVPEPKRSGVVWVNVYNEKLAYPQAWNTIKEVDRNADTTNRIARIRVPWTEGQFDLDTPKEKE